jgi:hypothetical protein
MCPRGLLAQHIYEAIAQGLGIVGGSAEHVIGEYEALSRSRTEGGPKAGEAGIGGRADEDFGHWWPKNPLLRRG